MFSLLGLLYAIPFVTARTMFFNWAAVFLALALVYYLRLSFSMFAGFVVIGLLILWGNSSIFEAVGRDSGRMAIVSLVIFAVAWVGQFIGHKIEGNDMGEVVLIKRLLGKPYVAVAPRYVMPPKDDDEPGTE